MPDVDRQRANREAKALVLASLAAAHESRLLRYLAAESYRTEHSKEHDRVAEEGPHAAARPG